MTVAAATRGVEWFLVQTHKWAETVAFWKSLGYQLEFETDHHSGQMRHPAGGAYLFIAEVPEDAPVTFQPVLHAQSTTDFQPPAAGSVDYPFTEQHWGVYEMMLRDPDHRRVSIQVPIHSNLASA